jgi:hypothetical protein
MNRLLSIAILVALLWCGVELRHNRVRYRPAPPAGPWPTTIHYYVPDGTCINVRNPDGGRE